MAEDTRPAKYKGFTIRYSRGDWYVDDANGRVVTCVWSKKDGKRWVDAHLWLIGQDKLSVPAREVIERYTTRHEWDRDFKSLDDAKEFLRGFLK